ncbi:hypothetical protein [Hespellia stercorisuis]|uniref:Type 4 fimbrial biogenesis protein PilX N-terminal domain-containing protein n=1 Tax=Hespellia stercorisuis DSM 15480 TaxID=1121950 RepID=A0A1M6R1C4_9FIRM|nr:hypothetical protein [Hespellia stercorisuis]SHK26285.1 hypothetical protein SAMN02745243_02578 [Hespellia stercorisuis DSM 15480]
MVGEKIKSTSGATILLALLFFLMCAMAGSVVLAAGTASSGRIAGLREDEQAYYNVTSAAKVLRDSMEGEVFAYYSTKAPSSDETDNTYDYNQKPSGQFADLLKNAAETVFKESKEAKEAGKEDDALYKKALKISTSSADLTKTVIAEFTMKPDYEIEITLYEEGQEDGYECILTIPAAISMDADIPSGEPGSGQELGADNQTVVKYKTTLTWTDAVITTGSEGK